MERVLMHKTQHWVVRRPGWVVARDGGLWVTRSGDLADHILARGERLALRRGDDVVVQALHRDMPALWDWQPRAAPHYALRRALLAWVRSGAARALRGAAAVLDDLAARARSAAARACRAQGCIGAGDSIASGGTVQ